MTYEIKYVLNYIKPFFDEIKYDYYGMPTDDEIKEEIIRQRPNLVGQKNIIEINTITKILRIEDERKERSAREGNGNY